MPRIFRCFAAVYNTIVHITVGFQKFVHLFGSSRHFFILCSINNNGTYLKIFRTTNRTTKVQHLEYRDKKVSELFNYSVDLP